MIDQMATNLSQFTVNPEKDFSRKKKWDFPTLMKFIISMEGQSLKNELHKYFGYTLECPSNASLNQRRSQVKSDAFKYLFNSFTSKFSKTPKLFKGYKLLACDGSDINISHNPCDEETYFQQGTAKGFNQLHLNAMYDLMNRYGLLYKLYNPNSDEWLKPIDFDKINRLMEEEIADSYCYLQYEIDK